MIFEIGEINKSTPYLFADLAELLVCIGYNGRKRLHKNDLVQIYHNEITSLDEIDDETRQRDSFECNADFRDEVTTKIDDVWAHLEYRSQIFEHLYPFELTNAEIFIKQRCDLKYYAYYLLLACSRLRSFPTTGGIRQRWATAFTELCKYTIRGLMPAHADVKVFDANSTDRSIYYGTDTRDALKKLGNDLSAIHVNETECERASSSGDVGIDLVATVNFDDGAATSYAVLAQCASQQKEWPKKTLEAHPERHRGYFQTLFSWPSVMFIPLCYRNGNGSWINNSKTSGVLLLDRVRIFWLLEKENSWQRIFSEEWFLDFQDEFKKVKL